MVIKSIFAVTTIVVVMTVTSNCLMPVFHHASSAFAASLLAPLAISKVIQALINIIPNIFNIFEDKKNQSNLM